MGGGTTKDTKSTKGLEFDDVSKHVIGCAIEVHKHLGPGLLESTYQQCLAHELAMANIPFRMEYPVAVDYKGVKLDCGYKIDVLVDDSIILELKSVDEIQPIHKAQLLTYMKLAGISIGLLLNFNVRYLKSGIVRMVL